MTLAPASAPGVRLRRARRGDDGVVRVRTDVASFVGYAERGPVGVPVRVRTMRAFEGVFGGYHDAGFLAYAARGFFENGGDTLLAVRVAAPLPELGAARARTVLPGVSGAPLVEITAGSAGVWGNGLSVALTPARRIEAVVAHPPITATAFDLGETRGFAPGQLLGFRQPGGAVMHRVLAAVDASSGRLFLVHPDPARRQPGEAALTGLDPTLPLRIERVAYDLTLRRDGRLVAVYSGLELGRQAQAFMGAVLAPAVPDADGILPETTPMIEARLLAPPEPLAAATGQPQRLAGGRNGLAAVTVADHIAALATLEGIADVAMLAMPDLTARPDPTRYLPIPDDPDDPCAICPAPPAPSPALPPPVGDLPPELSEADIAQAQAAMVTQAERLGDRIALLDPPPARAARTDALVAWRQRTDSTFAALFTPWLTVADPRAAQTTRNIPPSGHAAGQLAAVDLATGPHRAAANLPLVWAQGPTAQLHPAEHGLLNAQGITVITARDGRPARLMGARTLGSDARFRYLTTRRLMILLRRSLEVSLHWVPFEPNSGETRALLSHTISVFLEALRRGGALAGDTPDESWRVRCDDVNNPPRTQALGRLIVDIGVAPAMPLEFITLTLGVRQDGFDLIESGANPQQMLEAV